MHNRIYTHGFLVLSFALGLGACQKEEQATTTPTLGAQAFDLHFVNHQHSDTVPPENNEQADTRRIRAGQHSPSECDPVPQYFTKQVWEPFMATSCYACHRTAGYANTVDFNGFALKGRDQEDWLNHNLNILKSRAGSLNTVIDLQNGVESTHQVGYILKADTNAGTSFLELISRLETWEEGQEPCLEEDILDDVEIADAKETLRSAALTLVGRLPNSEELAAVQSDPAQLPTIIDGFMAQEPFPERVAEIYNDTLLTDFYTNFDPPGASQDFAPKSIDKGRGALWRVKVSNSDENLRFPEWDFIENTQECEDLVSFAADASEFCALAKTHTNNAIAREPLKIIEHVVRHNKPFNEIITADYTMVNAYSAVAMGYFEGGVEILDGDFVNPLDPNEYHPARLSGHNEIPFRPHAGILTTSVYLQRRPTNNGNRNRHRARLFYKDFLDLDILDFVDTPMTEELGDNPTYQNPICAPCHRIMDPVSGAHQNWNHLSYYNPENTWYDEFNQENSGYMVPTGFEGEIIPEADRSRALAWLAQRISNEQRFGHAVASKILEGLTGLAPLKLPRDSSASDYDDRYRAYESQKQFMETLVSKFFAESQNIKTIFREIILSPYFRARRPNAQRRANKEHFTPSQYSAFGTGHLLTNEVLDRKIKTVTGMHWDAQINVIQDLNKSTLSKLIDPKAYRLFANGIDSDTIVERTQNASAITAATALRMAVEMACKVVPSELGVSPENRKLFLFADKHDTPESPYGEQRIKQNIAHLFKTFLGQDLSNDDEEIVYAYNLFVQTWESGRNNLHNGDETVELNCWKLSWAPEFIELRYDPNYVIRSWMAVVTYLLGDFYFLFD